MENVPDAGRGHGWRAGRGDEDGASEFAAHEAGAIGLLTLKSELLAFQREGNRVAGLQVQGLAKALGDYQLAFGREGGGVHGENLTGLTGGGKATEGCVARIGFLVLGFAL